MIRSFQPVSVHEYFCTSGPSVAAAKSNKSRKQYRPPKGPQDSGKFANAPLTRPGIKEEISTTLNELADQLSTITLDNSKDEREYLRFENMGLNPKLLQGIYAYGLETPATVQQRVIVPCVRGRDVIIQAQSGMGKTAALAISILQRIDLSNPQCQALIIAPTRELAEQICVVFTELGKFLGVATFACIGGTNTKKCKAEVKKGKQIIVGTTGRLVHMLINSDNADGQHFLSLNSLKSLAMDEADHMLMPNFKRDLKEIFERIPLTTQIILTSATMPEETLRLTPQFMRRPLKFLVKNEELTLEGIQQYYLNCENEGWKLDVLSDIYSQISKAQGMIFCNTRKTVTQVSKAMEYRGLQVSAMRGDLDQVKRDSILREFRMGKTASRMLITSDLLGRGIDVQQVNLVINYDLPHKKEEYIHRVGRGGRYGRKGVAVTFVTEAELPKLKAMEQFYDTKIEDMKSVDNLLKLLLPIAMSN